MRFRSIVAAALLTAFLLGGCGSNQNEATTAPTEAPTTAPETVATIATEPSTLPPSRPPEEALPEIEALIEDVPNATVCIEDGVLRVETCDEVTTGTGSIAYDRFDGGADAWQKVIDNSVALCLLMRTKMDDQGVTDTPAKVVVTDYRNSRPILTVVDGNVTEDTVAIELAKAPPMLPNAPYGSNGKTTIGSGSQGRMVWIPTHGGTKYHLSRDCSGMINPDHVSIENAQAQGFEPCKKCYG